MDYIIYIDGIIYLCYYPIVSLCFNILCLMEGTMKKSTKTIRITLVFLFLTILSSTCAFAAPKDGAVKRTASSVYVDAKVITAKEAKENKNWKKNYYKARACGSVTLQQYKKKDKKWVNFRHYTNTELLCMGFNELYSGRVWGKGKVSANTSFSKKSCGIVPDYYGCSVWYGW